MTFSSLVLSLIRSQMEKNGTVVGSESALTQSYISSIVWGFFSHKLNKITKQTFFFLQHNSQNGTVQCRWHPLIMLWLVQKCAWSAKSSVSQMCLLRQRFQQGLTIRLLSLQSKGKVCACVCADTYSTCACTCV